MKKIWFILGILLVWGWLSLCWIKHFATTTDYHLSDFFTFRKWDTIGVQMVVQGSKNADIFNLQLSWELVLASGNTYWELELYFSQKTNKLWSDLSFSTVSQVLLDKEELYLSPSSLEIFWWTGNIANNFYSKLSSDLIGKTRKIPLKETNFTIGSGYLLSELLNALSNDNLSGVATMIQKLPQFSWWRFIVDWELWGTWLDKINSFSLQWDQHIFSLSLLSLSNSLRITWKANQFSYILNLSEKKGRKIWLLEIMNILPPNEKVQISFSLFPLKEKKSLQILPNTYSSLQHYLENLNRAF